MDVEILTKRDNPLLHRTEVQFAVEHAKALTPTREAVRDSLAALLKAQKERVIVDHVRTEFGRPRSTGYAKVYASVEDAKKVERPHILVRNKLAEAEKKEVKEKKAPPAKAPPAAAAPPAKPPAKEKGA